MHLKVKNLLIVLALIAVASLAWLYWLNFAHISVQTPLEHSFGRDFYPFYIVSNAIASGAAENVFIPEEFEKLIIGFYDPTWHWLYPPVFLLIISWLALFSYYTALFLSITGQIILFAAACRNYLANNRLQLLAYLGLPCLFTALNWGQFSVIIAALYILGFRYVERKPVLSGFFWGVAAVKPTMIFLIPVMLLAQKKYKALISMCVSFLLMIILSVLAYGIEPWVNYLTVNVKAINYYLSELRIVHFNMPTIYSALLMLGVSSEILKFLQPLIIIVGAIVVFLVSRKQQTIQLWQIIIISILTILSTPYAYNLDFLMVGAFFLAWFIKSYDHADIAAVLALFVACSLESLTMFFNVDLRLPIMPLVLAGLALYIYKKRDLAENFCN